MENRFMTIQALLAELEQKHRALEIELEEVRAHPSVDTLRVAELNAAAVEGRSSGSGISRY
jgi:hypothetical protein